MAMALLYHVTRTANSKLIEQQGFVPGSPFAESGLAAAVAEAELQGEELGEFDVDEEGQAREYFNEFMDDARRKYPDKPSHDHAVFFWSNIRDAQYAKNQLEYLFGPGSMKIDIIDTDFVNCTFWSGDWNLSDELFFLCHSDLNAAMDCLQGNEESDCNEFDKVADQYYADMKPWDGTPQHNREIIAACHIPSSAIVNIVDPPKKHQGATIVDNEQTIADIVNGSEETIADIVNNDPPDETTELPFETEPLPAIEPLPPIEPLPAVEISPLPEVQPPIEESAAAEHFGRAICLGRENKSKPYDQLTPAEQQCVTQVGEGWENAIINKFETRVPATSINENASLIGTNGQSIGRLSLLDGNVTLCFNTGINGQPITPKCASIGSGFDSFVAAQQILDLLGVQVQATD